MGSGWVILTAVRIWGRDKAWIGWVPGGIAVAVGEWTQSCFGPMIMSDMTRHVQRSFFYTRTNSGRINQLVLVNLPPQGGDASHCSCERANPGGRRGKHYQFTAGKFRRTASMIGSYSDLIDLLIEVNTLSLLIATQVIWLLLDFVRHSTSVP